MVRQTVDANVQVDCYVYQLLGTLDFGGGVHVDHAVRARYGPEVLSEGGCRCRIPVVCPDLQLGFQFDCDIGTHFVLIYAVQL